MAICRAEIPLRLISANDYIEMCRKNKLMANDYKQDIESDIVMFIGHLPEFKNKISIHFIWFEETKRRDPDNVSFGAKFILDAMRKAGKIQNDNWRYVGSLYHDFIYSKESKVILEIMEAEHGAERIWDNSILGE